MGRYTLYLRSLQYSDEREHRPSSPLQYLVQCYFLECENSRLSLLLAARDVSAARRGGCFRRLISFLSETNHGCLELVKLGITTFILMIRIFRLLFIEFSQILQSFECTR